MHTSEQTRTPTILGRACSTHISSRGYKSLANIRNPWKTPLTCRILKKIQLLCFRKGKIITKDNKIRLMLSDTFALIRCSAFQDFVLQYHTRPCKVLFNLRHECLRFVCPVKRITSHHDEDSNTFTLQLDFQVWRPKIATIVHEMDSNGFRFRLSG